MKLYKKNDQVIIDFNGRLLAKNIPSWDKFINRKNLHQQIRNEIEGQEFEAYDQPVISKEAPIQSQEVWASGVTYMRSKEARMEESKKAGGGTFYDRVYEADRPELFFKSTPARTVGNEGIVRIRKDSGWDVPEPELTLFISSGGSIEGYTIGNDMSSRSIEGENPLYLPQAKTYDGCAGLGPCIYVPSEPINPNTLISIEIKRDNHIVFKGEIPISNMKRKHTDLVEYLFRECSFPNGCFLMTGTGIIPPDDFTLKINDKIKIHIENIGTLNNIVG